MLFYICINQMLHYSSTNFSSLQYANQYVCLFFGKGMLNIEIKKISWNKVIVI